MDQAQAPVPETQGRLRDSELERRVLDAALAMVARDGLFSGLAELSYESAIQAAGVPRSSAYRRWAKKQDFAAAVTLEVARGTRLTYDWRAELPFDELLASSPADLLDPQRRTDLFVDILRRMTQSDFTRSYRSPHWRIFVALTTMYPNLPDAGLREQVRAALAATGRRFASERAHNYATMADLMGLRLKSPLGGPDGWEQLSQAVGASFTGQLTQAWVDPEPSFASRRLRAFGISQPTQWTGQGLVSVACILSYLEVDPGVEWTLQRCAEVLDRATEFLGPRA